MEFDKSRVYTAANADELKEGSKVCVADNIWVLKTRLFKGKSTTLKKILSEGHQYRFCDGSCSFALAYLIEPPNENVLKWTDLKVGHIIRAKDGSETALVIGIRNYSPDGHINTGYWQRDSDLEKYWEKTED